MAKRVDTMKESNEGASDLSAAWHHSVAAWHAAIEHEQAATDALDAERREAALARGAYGHESIDTRIKLVSLEAAKLRASDAVHAKELAARDAIEAYELASGDTDAIASSVPGLATSLSADEARHEQVRAELVAISNRMRDRVIGAQLARDRRAAKRREAKLPLPRSIPLPDVRETQREAFERVAKTTPVPPNAGRIAMLANEERGLRAERERARIVAEEKAAQEAAFATARAAWVASNAAAAVAANEAADNVYRARAAENEALVAADVARHGAP